MRANRLEMVRRAFTTAGVTLLVAAFSFTVSGLIVAAQPAFALSAVKNFSISSEVFASTCTATPGATLAPGVTRCLAVTVHDPLSVDIDVKSLSMLVTSFTATPSNHDTPACKISWITSPTTLPHTYVVAAGSTHTVDATIKLLTTPSTTQGNCENGTFHFAYTGQATYTDSTSASLSISGSGRNRTLKATISPGNPVADPYGPSAAPVHHVVFYACTTASCTSKSLVATVTLTTTTSATFVAKASTGVSGLSTGRHYFEVAYPSTGTHTGTFTTSSAIASTTVSVSTTPPSTPSPPPGANFTVTKSDTPGSGKSVVPGATIDYSVVVKNTGTATGSATVTDPLPSNVTLSGPPTCTTVTSPDTCAVKVTGSKLVMSVTLASGDSAKATFDAVVSSTDTTTVTNTATITDGACTTTQCSSTVTNPVVVLSVVKSSVPVGGSVVPLTTKVTYTLTLTDSGTAATTPETLSDQVPGGMTYVPGSATCGGAPGCSVTEATGTVTWSGIVVQPGASNAVSVSFEAVVNKTDTTAQTISNSVTFNNQGTPGCTTTTCSTNTVTVEVNAKSSAASSSTPPGVSTVPGATTPHTGEPFAGSDWLDLVALLTGLGLLVLGEVLRRRQKRAAAQ